MSETPDPVLIDRHDNGVVVVTMNNQKTRNALSPEMMKGMADAIEALSDTPEVRAIVLTGSAGAFCSGGDISRMAKDRQVIASRNSMRRTQRVISAIVNSPKPVIAAVEGSAFGAGMSLAAGADFTISAEGARYCAAFAKVSLAPDMGLYWTVSQRVGISWTKRLIMLASVVDSEQALKLGLVDEVVADGTALSRALELAAELAEMAPLTLAVTKAVFADGCLTLEDAFRAERDHQPMMFRSSDHPGAVDAFKTKTKFRFEGR